MLDAGDKMLNKLETLPDITFSYEDLYYAYKHRNKWLTIDV